MDVYHAKKFIEFFKRRLDTYEGEFGKIERPKQLKKVEKKRKESKKEKPETPTYFG